MEKKRALGLAHRDPQRQPPLEPGSRARAQVLPISGSFVASLCPPATPALHGTPYKVM